LEELLKYAKDKLNLKEMKPNQYSALVLAYIGDAVYEVVIRTMVISNGNAPVNKLHKSSREYVKASGQAKIYHKISDMLTEEEMSAFKRGRNAKSGSVPRNANIGEYRIATGLEALIGYLYIKNDYKRIIEIISEGVKDDETSR
jgi:ribonuclease-3 family protein